MQQLTRQLIGHHTEKKMERKPRKHNIDQQKIKQKKNLNADPSFQFLEETRPIQQKSSSSATAEFEPKKLIFSCSNTLATIANACNHQLAHKITQIHINPKTKMVTSFTAAEYQKSSSRYVRSCRRRLEGMAESDKREVSSQGFAGISHQKHEGAAAERERERSYVLNLKRKTEVRRNWAGPKILMGRRGRPSKGSLLCSVNSLCCRPIDRWLGNVTQEFLRNEVPKGLIGIPIV